MIVYRDAHAAGMQVDSASAWIFLEADDNVAVGAAAALSVKHASKRWSGFGDLARRVPYFSSVLIILVGLYTAYLGIKGLGVTHY